MAETFGSVLMRHRLDAGLTRAELAAMVDCHETYVGALEGGRRTPSRRGVEAFATAFGLGVAETDRFLYAAGYAPRTDYQTLYERRVRPPEPVDIDEIFSERVKRLCRERELSISQVAYAAGLPTGTIVNCRDSAHCAGMTAHTVHRVAVALGVSFEYLWTGVAS